MAFGSYIPGRERSCLSVFFVSFIHLGPGRNEQPESSSGPLTWIARAEALGPSSTAFPGH